MYIGSAEAKRTDTGHPRRFVASLPFLQFCRHIKPQFFPVDARVFLFQVKEGRILLVFERKNHLHQTGDSSCSFEMTDVCLSRADSKCSLARTTRKDFTESLKLDRIT